MHGRARTFIVTEAGTVSIPMKYSIEWDPAADCENRSVAAIDRSIYETDKRMTSFERVSGRL